MWVQQTMESEQKLSLGNGYQEENRKEEVQEKIYDAQNAGGKKNTLPDRYKYTIRR